MFNSNLFTYSDNIVSLLVFHVLLYGSKLTYVGFGPTALKKAYDSLVKVITNGSL